MIDRNALTPNGWGGMGVERPPLPPIQINPETTHTNPEPTHA